jgi:conjugative transfer signal peptidase TraF
MTDDRPSATLLPLFRWGDALRAAKLRRRRFRRRATAIGVLAAALGATIIVRPAPLLVWNASASAPVGLYAVGPQQMPESGNMVIARVPAAWRRLAAIRHYLPENVPLVKRVVAAPGDTVCARGAEITVNGREAARRLARDGSGRPMPWWNGCVTLRHGALFLLMTDSPASFDGRYFGPTPRGDIIGKARSLWTR